MWTSEEQELIEALVAGRPLMDVRAPVEFRQGAIPGAVNLPVLNDVERAAVGTAYKVHGQAAAIALGHQLVSGPELKARLDKWAEFIEKQPEAWLYCFRGGLRSQSVAAALKERGLQIPVIRGGYKRLRSLLLNSLSLSHPKVAILSGFTGAGKTQFLEDLQDQARVCDLESLASHRGSAFGRRPSSQPSQIDFENRLAVDLLRAERSPRPGPLWLEDESRMIGGLTLPAEFFAQMMTAPLYVLERPREDRAAHLIKEYLADFDLHEGVVDAGRLQRFRESVGVNLGAISKRLGGLEYRAIYELFEVAILEQSGSGRLDVHQEWVERVLARYYDPLYSRHLDRESARIVARGTASELRALLD